MDNSSSHKHVYDVAIVGAGVAGLTASQVLKSHGLDYIILEGNSRIGGRTWTVSVPSSRDESKDIYLDLGGAWIHGCVNNPLYEFLSQYNLEFFLDSTDEEALVVGKEGKIYSDSEEYNRAKKDFLKFFKALKKVKFGDDYFNLSLEDVFQSLMRSPKLSENSDSSNFYWRSLDLLKTSWELYNGASFKDLSVWDEDIVCPGGDILIKGGYRHLIDILSKDLEIQYDHHVVRVDYSKSKYAKLVCTNGIVIRARKVISSIPLGVLQSGDVQFIPPLPEWKNQSISSMGMGLMDKMILQFENVFWDPTIRAYKYLRNDHSQFSWISNFYPSTGEPILILISAADTAESMAHLSDEEVLEKAMTVLRDVFGDKVEDPIRTIRTNWLQNIYSRGSYSYCKAGSRPSDVVNLAAPVEESLYFCGEHTISEYLGCVHSAFISGKRASIEVLESIKSQFERDNK